MSLEIKIPSVGESVQEAVLAEWFKQDGEPVKRMNPCLSSKRIRSPWKWWPRRTAC